MELVAFAGHVHLGALPGGRDGREVGVDRFLPQAQADEDVRRHVERVRRGRRDLRVAARGVETHRGKLGLVAAVNQVMRDARLIGVLREQLVQDRNRLLPIVERRVVGRLAGEQRQRVERGGLGVVRVVAIDLLHAVGVGLRAGHVIASLGIAEKGGGSREISLLTARGVRAGLSLLDLRPAAIEIGLAHLLPELVVEAHRGAPVRHRATRRCLRDGDELLFGFLVPERVEQRDAALEVLLHGGRTRRREPDRAELLLVVVVLRLLRHRGPGSKEHREGHCHYGQRLHSRPPCPHSSLIIRHSSFNNRHSTSYTEVPTQPTAR